MRLLNNYYILTALVIVLGMAIKCGNVLAEEEVQSREIICEEGLASIEVAKIKPEQLFRKLGKECEIKIVAHGDVDLYRPAV
jgi:hypothetical protein